MKIAVIGQKGIPSRAGGVEIHVEEIMARMIDYDNTITVYCRESYCSEKYTSYRGIRIKYMKSLNSKHLDAITYTFLSTIDAIRNKNDIIHYHALGPTLLSFIPRLFGIKVVSTCHGLDWQREKWGKFAKFALKLGEISSIKFPQEIIVVSKKLQRYYMKKYDKKTIYIPNGIENKKRLKPNIIKDVYGLKKDEYILFLARLVPEKGAHYLIDAFNEIDTDKKLVIAGGSSHSNKYVNILKEKAKENKNIIFTGFVSGDTLDELFTNAYLYVLPSEIEGLPISLLEAMAYGQCCLVSDIEENLEVVENFAEVFKNKDVYDLKKKLSKLMKDNEKVYNYKNKSSEFIKSKYNWDNVSKETYEVYKTII